MKKRILRVFLKLAVMGFCLAISANLGFGQCGLPGTPPCKTNPKGTSKTNRNKLLLNRAQTKTAAVMGRSSAEAVRYFNYGENNCKADYDCFIRNYTKAIELNPRYTEAYISRGSAYSLKGNEDEAIKNFNQALVLDPNSSEAYESRAMSYDSKTNYDQAIKDYTKAIELNPRNSNAYSGRASSYKSQGNNVEAINDYTTAIKLSPKESINYTFRGLIYKEMGLTNLFNDDFRKSSELLNQKNKDVDRQTVPKPTVSKSSSLQKPSATKENNSPFNAEYIGGNTPPSVLVTNSSDRILNLKIGGNQYKIAAGSSKNIVLEPGFNAFSASAIRVRTLIGSRNFDRGYRYTWQFYIMTTQR